MSKEQSVSMQAWLEELGFLSIVLSLPTHIHGHSELPTDLKHWQLLLKCFSEKNNNDEAFVLNPVNQFNTSSFQKDYLVFYYLRF